MSECVSYAFMEEDESEHQIAQTLPTSQGWRHFLKLDWWLAAGKQIEDFLTFLDNSCYHFTSAGTLFDWYYCVCWVGVKSLFVCAGEVVYVWSSVSHQHHPGAGVQHLRQADCQGYGWTAESKASDEWNVCAVLSSLVVFFSQMCCMVTMAPSSHMDKRPPGRPTPWRYSIQLMT